MLAYVAETLASLFAYAGTAVIAWMLFSMFQIAFPDWQALAKTHKGFLHLVSRGKKRKTDRKLLAVVTLAVIIYVCALFVSRADTPVRKQWRPGSSEDTLSTAPANFRRNDDQMDLLFEGMKATWNAVCWCFCWCFSCAGHACSAVVGFVLWILMVPAGTVIHFIWEDLKFGSPYCVPVVLYAVTLAFHDAYRQWRSALVAIALLSVPVCLMCGGLYYGYPEEWKAMALRRLCGEIVVLMCSIAWRYHNRTAYNSSFGVHNHVFPTCTHPLGVSDAPIMEYLPNTIDVHSVAAHCGFRVDKKCAFHTLKYVKASDSSSVRPLPCAAGNGVLQYWTGSSMTVRAVVLIENSELKERFERKWSGWKSSVLFHGTSNDAASRIALEGYSLKHSKGGILGKGIYFAPHPFKSFGYNKGSNLLIVNRVVTHGARSKNLSMTCAEYAVPQEDQAYPLFILLF